MVGFGATNKLRVKRPWMGTILSPHDADAMVTKINGNYNIIGNESFAETKITYNFQNNNSLSFATRENKKTNITEFYNLIYQYRNDCLEAAIEYNKDYYADANTEPEEQLFFSISIKPFGSASTKGAN